MRRYLQKRFPLSLLLTGLGVLLLGGGLGRGSMSAAEVTEAAAKAEFVFRIIQFIDWEFSSDDEKFDVVVVDDAGFGKVLGTVVKGRTIQGREIVVRLEEDFSSLKMAKVVFVPGSNRRRLGAFLSEVADPKLLTLGESEAFLKAGGMISIVVSRTGKIRLGAERKVLERSGLKVSSKLMRILTR